MAIEPNRNVYVGHRYVPKIMGQWDNSQKYEGLSIVTHEGTSYTSKGYVPVGVDINNEDYWVVTGNYNAQVEHYRQDVQGVKDDVNDFKEEVKDDMNDIIYNVKDFGAMGDGVTDDTQSIRNAIQKLKETGGRLIFPKGVYIHGNELNAKAENYSQNGTTTVDGSSYPLYQPLDGIGYNYYVKDGTEYPTGDINIGENIQIFINGIENAEIIGYGAEIKTHENTPNVRNSAMFILQNNRNLKIKGLVLNGSKMHRKPFMFDSGNYNLMHNINIDHNNKNVTLEDVQSIDSVMDGIYINSPENENIRIINCSGINNYRQGLTVGSCKDITIEGGSYNDTGKTYGTLPMSGIDIETFGTAENVVFKNINFKNNLGDGLQVHSGAKRSVIENCYFENNNLYLYRGQSTARNNRFLNCGVTGESYGSLVMDNTFNFNSNVELDKRYAISVEDVHDYYLGGLARQGGIYNNWIFVDVENLSSDIDYLGVIWTGEKSNNVENNTLNNVFSDNPDIPIIGGEHRTLKNNRVHHRQGRDFKGVITKGLYIENNEVMPSYEMESEVNKNFDSHFKKNFVINDTGNSDYAIDFILKNIPVGGENTTIKVTYMGKGGIVGSFTDVIKISSGGEYKRIREHGSYNSPTSIYVSNPYEKNGENVITIKPEPYTNSKTSHRLYGNVVIEIYSTEIINKYIDILKTDAYIFNGDSNILLIPHPKDINTDPREFNTTPVRGDIFYNYTNGHIYAYDSLNWLSTRDGTQL